MTHTISPSWRLRRQRRLQNQLQHRGLTVDLNNTEDTIDRLRAYIAECDALIEAERFFTDAEGNKRPNKSADGNVIAKHMNNQRPAIALLHEAMAKREAAGKDTDDPTQAAAKARDFLVSLGWACTPPGENALPRVIAALETFPEAREAVLRVLGEGGVK